MKINIIFCVLISVVNSERILCLFGISSKSHNNIFTPLTLELASRGHDLTVVTAYPLKNTPKNYRQIDINNMDNFFNEANKWYNKTTSISSILEAWKILSNTCPVVLKNKQVLNLLSEKFDLIIISPKLNECCLPFASYFKIPYIYISQNVLMTKVALSMGIPEPVSYVPNYIVPYSDQMTFLQRVKNLLIREFINFFLTFVYYPAMNAAAKDFFGPNIPFIEDIEKNVSLALVNTDISWNYPRPTSANVIEIGGIHIKPKNDPLPRDIQEFLDNATHGVIYFSMGSILKGDQCPEQLINIFLETFKLLSQSIIWKFETEHLLNLSSNVKIGKWLPQQDILAHPNVKLFITHGGLLSTQEAIYYGVPIIGMPVYGDQPLNMLRNEQLGFAKTINLGTITKDTFLNAIATVIENPKYKDNALKLQHRMKDKPLTSLSTAVFWTEYVIRHNGADFLRSAAVKLPWYQLNSLDIFAFLIFVVFMFLFILMILCKIIFVIFVSFVISKMTKIKIS